MKLMKYVLVLLLGFWGNQVMGQTSMTTQDSIKASLLDTNGRPYLFVEEMPSFIGGEDEMMLWLQTNIKYPSEAIQRKYNGVSYVRVTIDCDGTVKDAKIERSSGYPILDEAAKSSISKMPKWKPGKDKGKKVAVTVTIPISFWSSK